MTYGRQQNTVQNDNQPDNMLYNGILNNKTLQNDTKRMMILSIITLKNDTKRAALKIKICRMTLSLITLCRMTFNKMVLKNDPHLNINL
jgi:hypothetical protein